MAQFSGKQTVFVFSGLGNQWPGMGTGLMRAYPFAQERLAALDRQILPATGISIVRELSKQSSQGESWDLATAYACSLSTQLVMAQLLESWGLHPGGVLGHSSGELLAAHFARVITLEQMVSVLADHVRIIRELSGGGLMLYAAFDEKRALELIAKSGCDAHIAAINGPASTVLSASEGLERLESALDAEGIFHRRLKMDVAFHSPHVEALAGSIRPLPVATNSPDSAGPVIFSSLFGGPLAGPDRNILAGHEFWQRHIRQPVRFADAMRAALNEEFRVFVEVSPHPALLASIEECRTAWLGETERFVAVGTMRRGVDDQIALFESLAQLKEAGHELNLNWGGHDAARLAHVQEALRAETSAASKVLTSAASGRARLALIEGYLLCLMGRLTVGRTETQENVSDRLEEFRALGIDSMTSVRAVQSIRSALGVKLANTALFDYPTIGALVARIEELMSGTQSATKEVPIARVSVDTSEPVAVVGMACCFPGGAHSPDVFREVLISGLDGTTEIPKDRFAIDEFHDPDPDAPGKSYVRRAGFLTGYDPALFDAACFRVPPGEARALDPQQRLLLETALEAFADAGMSMGDTRADVGVWLGISTSDYQAAHLFSGDLNAIDAYSATGSMGSAAAGRLSYFFGLGGPCVTVDTACSSSLVSLHLARTALLNGECSAALVAGVNLMLTPNLFVYFSKLRALSPDGRSKSFDASADGYGRGEGCGVLVLKRYADALRDGDRIHALIRGSAVNQDGRSNGLTAPNGSAQQAVIRQALRNASLGALDVDYVEAHGTGTPLGDPIELESIGSVYGVGRDKRDALIVGSVKANIGHLEAAAGVASVIKAIMALKSGEVPRQIHFHEPNPLIPWDELPVMIPRETYKWERRGHPRRAGVNAFGFSGTNAHVILEEAPPQQEPSSGQLKERASEVLCLSARGDDALRDMARQYARELDDKRWRDVVHSANAGRSGFDRRLAVVGESAGELSAALVSYADGAPSARVISALAGEAPAVVFQYTGQGSQHVGMGLELYESSVAYREAYDQAEAELSAALGESLRQKMYESTEQELERTQYAQPAIFAMQYALTALWRSLGIAPSAVMGHSVGEYAAAVAAGVMSLADGARLIVERGRLLGGLPEGVGVMAAVFAGEDEVRQALAGYEAEVSIATVNAPGVTVVSGASASVEKVLEVLKARGRKSKRLRVSHGFHSPLVEPVLGRFKEAAQRMEYRAPEIPFYSCLEPGRRVDMGAEYWTRHVREAVRYMDGARAAWADGYRVYLEVGPAATLSGLLKQSVDGAVALSSSAGRAGSEWTSVLEAVGRLYVMGAGVKLRALDAGHARNRVTLPHYPFQRKRFWREPCVKWPSVDRQNVNPLIGRRLDSLALEGARVYSASLEGNTGFIREHVIFGQPISPAAAHLASFIEASGCPCEITDVLFRLPLSPGAQGRHVQTIISKDGRGSIVSTEHGSDKWLTHCTAGSVAQGAPPLALLDVDRDGLRPFSPDEFYGIFIAAGYGLGPSYRRIIEINRRSGQAICHVQKGDDALAFGALHPGFMDSILQCMVHSTDRFLDEIASGRGIFIPFSLERMSIYRPLPDALVVQCRSRMDGELVEGDLDAFDEKGALVLCVRGLSLRRVTPDTLRQGATDGLILDIVNEEIKLPEQVDARGRQFVIVGGNSQEAIALKESLAAYGAEVLIARTEQIESIALEHKDKKFVVIWLPGTSEGLELAEAMREGVEGFLSLVKALAESMPLAGLVLVIDGYASGLAQSPLKGIALSAALEYPGMRVRVIERPAGNAEGIIEQLARVIVAELPESRIALDVEGRAYAERLSHAVGGQRTVRIAPDATYLIIGGLGSIGRQLALKLRDAGARNLLLLGRSSPDESARQFIRELEGTSVRVLAASVDIADHQALASAIHEARLAMPPIRGIFHTAGTLGDGVLTQLDAQRFMEVASGKVFGAWNLHLLSMEMEIEHFVLFSSAASLLGNAGQAAYAGANAFLDGLALHRKSLGLPGLSVNWGPWAGTSMLTENSSTLARLGKQGFESTPPGQMLEALFTLLASSSPRAGVMRTDWRAYLDAHEQLRGDRFFSRLLTGSDGRVAEVSAQAIRDARAPELLRELSVAYKSERQGLLVRRIKEVAAAVTGLGDPLALDADRPLMDQGIDSLMAVEVRNQLVIGTGVPLPAGVLFNHPTIGSLAGYLLQVLSEKMNPGQEPGAATKDGGVEQEDFSYLDDMSYNELEDLINEELSGDKDLE